MEERLVVVYQFEFFFRYSLSLSALNSDIERRLYSPNSTRNGFRLGKKSLLRSFGVDLK